MLLIVVSGTREDVPGLRETVWAELSACMRGAGEPVGLPHLLMHGACGWDASSPTGWMPHRLNGADRWAHRWAGVTPVPMPADWSNLGRAAGPERNMAMCAAAVMFRHQGWTVRALAFPGPKSKGTRDFIRCWGNTSAADALKVVPVGES